MITQTVVKRLLKPAEQIVPSPAVKRLLKPAEQIVPNPAVQINQSSNAALTALNPVVLRHNY